MNSVTDYKSYLADYLIRFHNINNLNDFFHCLNPQHIDNHPSMRFTGKYNICHCFSCNVNYDIFDLVGIDFNINNFKDQISKVEEIYSNYILKVDDINDKYRYRYNKVYDYTNYYNKCMKDNDKIKYLQTRGITNNLIKKYKIGYDEKRKLIVFPINENCYFARSTINDDKVKSKGNSDIWNKEYLYNSSEDDMIYVTEGIIDGLSLEVIDSKIKVISINGVGNINSLVREIKNSKFKGNIVISFDNDKAGIIAKDKLKSELEHMKVNCFDTTLISNFDNEICKDINKALILDKSLLEKNYNYFKEAFQDYIEKQKMKIGDDSYCIS